MIFDRPDRFPDLPIMVGDVAPDSCSGVLSRVGPFDKSRPDLVLVGIDGIEIYIYIYGFEPKIAQDGLPPNCPSSGLLCGGTALDN